MLYASAGLWDLELIGSILLFIAMMTGTLLLFRFLSKRGVMGQRSRHIKVLDRLYISRDCQILLMDIAGRTVAVSVGRDGGRLLCELSPEQTASLGLAPPQEAVSPSAAPRSAPRRSKSGKTSPGFSGFLSRFWHNFRIHLGLLPKSTPFRTPSSDDLSASEKTDAGRRSPSAGRREEQAQEAFAELLTRLRNEQDSAPGTPAVSRPPSVPSAAPSVPSGAPSVPSGASSVPSAAPSGVPGSPRGDYKEALENLFRRANESAPEASAAAAVSASLPPAGTERTGRHDKAAREFLAVLEQRQKEENASAGYSAASGAHYDMPNAKAAAKTSAKAAAKSPEPGLDPGGDGAYDELMDKIAKRQSRYSSGKDRGGKP